MTFGFSGNSSEAECADSDGADEGTILVCKFNCAIVLIILSDSTVKMSHQPVL